MKIRIGGRTDRLGDEIGRGGEGTVYSHALDANLAVKIYTSPTKERYDKVRAMVNKEFASHAEGVAFPIDIVYNTDGGFLGFTMKMATSHEPLHELWSPKSRRKLFPDFHYRKIISTTVNLAKAVHEVHRCGCVLGDINESGVLVSNDTRVMLVDADSFQFKANGVHYPCTVAKGEYIPPELQRGSSAMYRTRKHDEFGLAILIFQLLFMGRGPFSGLSIDPRDQRYAEVSAAIANYQFAYTVRRRREVQLRPPPYTLSLEKFPNDIRELFERAFGKLQSDRPRAEQWINALMKLEEMLVLCGKHGQHWYPKHNNRCVWCEYPEGIDPFRDTICKSSSKGAKENKTSYSFNSSRDWWRMLGGKPPRKPRVAARQTVTPSPNSVKSTITFQRGERVFHQKFGFGKITSYEGNRAKVAFDAGNTTVVKTVVASYLKPVK